MFHKTRPSDLEQRSGRILRQGNNCEYVRILRYVTEGSFDSYSYQTLETKQKFISQIMDYEACSTRSIEDVDGAALSYAEIKAIATGNPLMLEKFKVDSRLRELELLKSQFDSDRRRLTHERDVTMPERIKTLKDKLVHYEEDSKHVVDLSGEHFRMTVGKQKLTERKAAGE